MPISVIRTGKPIQDTELSTEALMREVGLLARERIIRRTIAGIDQDGAAFRPYSLSYALLKARELGAAGVNLQVSGAMLNALQITEVTAKSVTLGFR